MDHLRTLSAEHLVGQLSVEMRQRLDLVERRPELVFADRRAHDLRSLAREVLCRTPQPAKAVGMFPVLLSEIRSQRERTEQELAAMLGKRDVRNLSCVGEGDVVFPIFSPLRSDNFESVISSARPLTVSRLLQKDGCLVVSLEEFPMSILFLATCFLQREHRRVVNFPLPAFR